MSRRAAGGYEARTGAFPLRSRDSGPRDDGTDVPAIPLVARAPARAPYQWWLYRCLARPCGHQDPRVNGFAPGLRSALHYPLKPQLRTNVLRGRPAKNCQGAGDDIPVIEASLLMLIRGVLTFHSNPTAFFRIRFFCSCSWSICFCDQSLSLLLRLRRSSSNLS
jgi:hypothetical protein